LTVASSLRLLELRPARENEGIPEPSTFEVAPIATAGRFVRCCVRSDGPGPTRFSAGMVRGL